MRQKRTLYIYVVCVLLYSWTIIIISEAVDSESKSKTPTLINRARYIYIYACVYVINTRNSVDMSVRSRSVIVDESFRSGNTTSGTYDHRNDDVIIIAIVFGVPSVSLSALRRRRRKLGRTFTYTYVEKSPETSGSTSTFTVNDGRIRYDRYDDYFVVRPRRHAYDDNNAYDDNSA